MKEKKKSTPSFSETRPPRVKERVNIKTECKPLFYENEVNAVAFGCKTYFIRMSARGG